MANQDVITRALIIAVSIVMVWYFAAFIGIHNDTASTFDSPSSSLNNSTTILDGTTTADISVLGDEVQDDLFDDVTPTSPIVVDKVAAIVEDRHLPNLVPLLLHFASVLGPSWPVILYTSAELAANLSASPALMRWAHQIGIRTLPEETKFSGHESVSKFLTTPWFWWDLGPARHVLLFQADSVLCANAPQSVDDFLGYDFVGAPVAEQYGQGYNGGLSLRNREKIVDIIEQHHWEDEQNQPHSKFEDQWFFEKMKELPNIMLPTMEVAQRFAVETIYYDRPLGYHQVKRWQSSRMAEIEEWCPEVRLTIGSTFV